MCLEGGETTQAVSKYLRYGPYSTSPYDSEHKTNVALVEEELADIVSGIQILARMGVINSLIIENMAQDNTEKWCRRLGI